MTYHRLFSLKNSIYVKYTMYSKCNFILGLYCWYSCNAGSRGCRIDQKSWTYSGSSGLLWMGRPAGASTSSQSEGCWESGTHGLRFWLSVSFSASGGSPSSVRLASAGCGSSGRGRRHCRQSPLKASSATGLSEPWSSWHSLCPPFGWMKPGSF